VLIIFVYVFQYLKNSHFLCEFLLQRNNRKQRYSVVYELDKLDKVYVDGNNSCLKIVEIFCKKKREKNCNKYRKVYIHGCM
jgi:hypothetical protein